MTNAEKLQEASDSLDNFLKHEALKDDQNLHAFRKLIDIFLSLPGQRPPTDFFHGMKKIFLYADCIIDDYNND